MGSGFIGKRPRRSPREDGDPGRERRLDMCRGCGAGDPAQFLSHPVPFLAAAAAIVGGLG